MKRMLAGRCRASPSLLTPAPLLSRLLIRSPASARLWAKVPGTCELSYGRIVPETTKPFSKPDQRFLKALQTFFELEGHFLVRANFVVPSAKNEKDPERIQEAQKWPRELWGFQLGKRLRSFTRGRDSPFKSAILRSIGFPEEDWRAYVWREQTMPALRAFKANYGHLYIKQAFMVPMDDPTWPSTTWSLNLGGICLNIRCQRTFTPLTQEQLDDLDAIGFIWSEVQWKWETQLLPALQRFHELFGHSRVPVRFTVPSQDPCWPEDLWGYKLGVMAAHATSTATDSYPNDRGLQALKELGFFDEQGEKRAWEELVMPSLEVYASRVQGDAIEIPVDFAVPHEAPWPQAAWGLKLGYVVHCIATSVLFDADVQEHRSRLREIGYAWDSLVGKWERAVLPALAHFQLKFGHCDVPGDFVVPSSRSKAAASWPRATWGCRLGNQVVVLRRDGRDSADVVDVIEQLDEVGFCFDSAESAFVYRVLPAFEAYASKHGDCNVPQGFIVPATDEWPACTWNMKLGHIVRDMRSRHLYSEQVQAYGDRLSALGFVWNIHRLNVSTVYTELVLSYWEVYKHIYNKDVVPVDFVVPGDDPRWPQKARHFALGAWMHRYNQRLERAKAPPAVPSKHRAGEEDTSTVLATDEKAAGGSELSSAKKPEPHPRRRHVDDSSRHGQIELPHYQEQYWKEVLLASFEAYAALHGGSCRDMPSDFVVPNMPEFPAVAWGLNLGLRLWHVRHGDRYDMEVAKYEKTLHELGVIGAEGSGSGKPLEEVHNKAVSSAAVEDDQEAAVEAGGRREGQ